FRDEVQEERFLLHSRHFDEAVFVMLEERACGVVYGDVFSVNLTNLFVYSLMDFPPHIDCLAQVLEIDVEIWHQEFSETEGQQQLSTLFQPVAVCDFEGAEGEGPVAEGPVFHHGKLLEASRVPYYEGAFVYVKLVGSRAEQLKMFLDWLNIDIEHIGPPNIEDWNPDSPDDLVRVIGE